MKNMCPVLAPSRTGKMESNEKGTCVMNRENRAALLCGTAIREITPTVENGVLPMPVGFSPSQHPITCVHDPLHLRVIALRNGGTTILYVCADVVNLNAKVYGPALARHTGIPEEALFLIETGAHATIRAGADGKNGTDPEGLRRLKLYEGIVMEQLLAAADEALAHMVPVKVGVGRSECMINTYRYRLTEVTEGEESREINTFATNLNGPTDREMITIRFSDPEGRPVAFIIHYALFSVMMDDNIMGPDDTTAISADVGGFVSTHMEKRFPGSVAIWSPGAGCDQNPILMAKAFYPDPDGSGFNQMYLPGDACECIWNLLGNAAYDAALRSVRTIDHEEEGACLHYARDEMPIPGRKVTQEKVEGTSFLRYTYQNGEPYTVRLTMLRIGETGIFFHGGNVFSSLGKKLKEESILKNALLTTGYVSSQVPFFGGLTDDRALEEGGHDGRGKRYRPGFIADALTLLANRLAVETEDQPYEAESMYIQE